MSGTRVTASSPRSSGAAGALARAGGPRRWVLPAVIIGATLLALGLRLYDLSRPGYLLGISEYDDGTDFGSAVRLVHGALPYRDFIMVQPPGITLIMFPVALATKALGTDIGMAVARVITVLASVAAVPVAGLLTRHRGLFATLVTCGVLAIYPDSILASRTVLLEPWLVLFCLLGALAVFDGDRVADSNRRLLLGGVLFGFAGAVKVWAILPVVVILVLTARRPRRAAVYAAGVVAGFCVPVLPFALAAPATFYRSVVVAQLVRNDITRIPEGYRLQQMMGLTHVSELATPALVVIGIVFVLLIAAVTVLGSRLAHSPPPALDWFATGTCALVVAAFLWPADFYYHYAAFLAPFLALVIALPMSRLLATVPTGGATPLEPPDGQKAPVTPSPGPWPPTGGATPLEPPDGQKAPVTPSPGPWPPTGGTRRWLALIRPGATIVAALVIVVMAVLQVFGESHEYAGVPASEISAVKRLIPPGACVATDQVSFTIAIDRFVSTVPGCSLMIDGVGTDYALSNGRNGQTGAGSSPAVAAAWMSAFRAAKYAWLTSEAYRRIPWTPQLRAYFDSHFTPLLKGDNPLYVRNVHRPG